MSTAPGDPPEHDVGITFTAQDYLLTVYWSMSDGDDEESVVAAATDWFEEKYGFNPANTFIDVEIKIYNVELGK